MNCLFFNKIRKYFIRKINNKIAGKWMAELLSNKENLNWIS
jgi:hypothetical protein